MHQGYLPKILVFLFLAFFLTALPGQAGDPKPNIVRTWDFEKVPVGQLPQGWKVAATRQVGPLAMWQVIEDKTAPSGRKVLALVKINHRSGGTFNLCWTDQVAFLNGTLEVAFRAVRGRIDEGGGILWRAQGKDNYYVARFNPLEDNFRIYYIKNGSRRIIASARVKLATGRWHLMKIIVQGNHYTCHLNGHKYLDVRDTHFTKAGGVGLWTKADAVTSFDGFKILTEN